MEFNIHKKALLEEGRLVMDQDYRGYNISIASERGGYKAELCVFDKEGDIVSKRFSCFKGGMIFSSVENIRIIMNEIDNMEDKVGVRMERMDDLPPGSNPFNYDMDRQGIQANEFMAMWSDHYPHELRIIHLATGVHVKVDCTELKEYYNAVKKGDVFDPHVWVCTNCASPDKHNWSARDTTGTTSHYHLLEFETHARGILSCDICGE